MGFANINERFDLLSELSRYKFLRDLFGRPIPYVPFGKQRGGGGSDLQPLFYILQICFLVDDD